MEHAHVVGANDAAALEGWFISSDRYAKFYPLTQLPEDVTESITNRGSDLIAETHCNGMTSVLALEVFIFPLQTSIVILFRISKKELLCSGIYR